MLEAIRERAQGWIARIILGFIVLTFAIWGVDSYFQGGGKEAAVATLDGDPISQRDFLDAVKQQRTAMGVKGDLPAEIDKALRKQVVDQLVDIRLLARQAQDAGFTVSEAQMSALLAGIEVFQDNGKFSKERLDAFLRSRNWTEQKLTQMIQQDILLRQAQFGYGEGAVVPTAGIGRLAQLLSQQREVNEAVYDAKSFLNLVKIDDASVEQAYNTHQQDYALPAQARVQFVVLSQDAIKDQIQVSDAMARQSYESNKVRYQQPESRRASHILIQAGTDANAKAAAKAKAEKVLQEVKAQPARFAELAKKFSDDPGSAAKGGDLGNFTRDMMVKPFSDAAYRLKVGEISGLVESQFGYHIIRVDGITPGAQIGFDTVKAEIMRELQGQEAARKFAEAAERFSNMVYEQPDSLEPAAREFKLKLEESGWVRAGNAQPAILSNPRLIDAIFGNDALAKRQNTEAIEVAPNTLVAARVLEHRPASTRPLAEVAPMIRLKLQNEAAGKKAAEAGQQALQAVQNGQAPSGLSAPMTVSRMRPLNLPPVAIKAIFKANATKLPAWTGVETADGYRLYRINQVMPGEMPPEQAKAMRRDLQRLFAQAEMRAYIDGLKAKSEVKVNQDMVDKKAE
ncbi:MAG: SurA N-terminal domain-containing protein [Betaproteobacteria bacterium]|nr:SurA N-terminal domain-containing protein [Betaproteobacteria bacterium]